MDLVNRRFPRGEEMKINQKAYVISRLYDRAECDLCKGVGEIGNQHECPECNGDGYCVNPSTLKWRVKPSQKITVIRVEETTVGTETWYRFLNNYSFYLGEQVFENFDEAMAECERRNDK
jgi:RecJ-like exonuclease